MVNLYVRTQLVYNKNFVPYYGIFFLPTIHFRFFIHIHISLDCGLLGCCAVLVIFVKLRSVTNLKSTICTLISEKTADLSLQPTFLILKTK